jgi:3-methyl-2-oxobutanoate hydroxymethyltransferase
VTIKSLQEMKAKRERIVALGVYDSVTATIADELGYHVFMTGPSGPMSLFGHTNPAQISFEEQLTTLRAVTRLAKHALINAHMPFLTYHASKRDAVLNAGRLVAEGGAETVKCDATRALASNIKAIVDSGIPVIAHIGLQASRRVEQSGYGVKGATAEEAKRIIDDADVLLDAGVFAFLIEHVCADVTALLTERLPVPTISLGSGPDADGICIVSGDALNYSVFPRPAHAGQVADLRATIERGLGEYARQVRGGEYPSEAHAYHLSTQEHAAFLKAVEDGQTTRPVR